MIVSMSFEGEINIYIPRPQVYGFNTKTIAFNF